MTKRVLVLNGPNINLLGERETDLYGHTTLAEVEQRCTALGQELDLDVRFEQSNAEGKMIDIIQDSRKWAHGIIINPAAYTHTSIALLDALNAFIGVVYELHISNVYKRENFRQKSFVSLRSDGVMAGFGVDGYEFALHRMANVLYRSPVQ